MLPSLVFLLLSRLAGADEEESVKLILCIGVIIMQQNIIRRMTPFRRTIDYNVARCGYISIALIVQSLHYLARVVYICGATPVKFIFRLQLQKISPA